MATDEEIIRYKDRYYILSSSAYTDDRTRVLKQGDTFAVFDRYGDFHPLGAGGHGLFHTCTRFLSRLEMRIQGRRPFLLSSTVVNDNILLAVDMTNPDFIENGLLQLPRGTLHIFRGKFIWNGTCYERIRITHYGSENLDTHISLAFNADFVDIFEVRGLKRARRGEKMEPELVSDTIKIPYVGLDGVERCMTMSWSASHEFVPDNVRLPGDMDGELSFHVRLKPKSAAYLYVTYHCGPGEEALPPLSYDEAYSKVSQQRKALSAKDCSIYTANEQFNEWLHRSYADIHMMTQRLPEGLYPYAGVPWFDTVFGRDGLLTAFSYLWINPELARGVLKYLAVHQAKESNAETDAEPGKILHETRKGEMAKLKEIPFGLYYGSADSTPLFVVLAGAYFERTGDLAFMKALWPHIEAAMAWIKDYGDSDGDGFVEYQRNTPRGLRNQGWKDSEDSIFHHDGSLADGPLALCEIQGYVFDALNQASKIAAALGKPDRAAEFSKQAITLQIRFEKQFWNEEQDLYALALDGEKRPCHVRASNPGHCLFSGIASPEHARKIGDVLLGPDFFGGWGVRTLATTEPRFNPMSYHNGSVWPHDNALIAYGLSRYGMKEQANKILLGLFDASLFVDLRRLPELFCGFHRRDGEGPTLYPVACSPQSWASASVFLLVQSLLGLSINGREEKVYLDHPLVPDYLPEISLKNLTVGSSRLDLTLRHRKNDVDVEINRREGPVRVIVVK